ncbi:MAG TPA: 2-oxo acid dehydrogenase subunit E2 [Bacteroidales bacterium]|nr:2-oxo acid dehydrogenase subunit E2 [Bacteroidales bacterium]
MATPVIMPKQGQSVETCIITQWFKAPGDKVSTGDILFSYETDKAAFDLESPADGILLETFFGEGEEVPVLVNVAVIGQKGEPADPFRPFPVIPDITVNSSLAQPQPQHISQPQPQPQPSATGTRFRISPRARRLAEEKGIDYRKISGSGPNGRIIVSDIEKPAAGPESSFAPAYTDGAEFTEKPLSNVRVLIAKAMHNSLKNSAQLTHHMSADARRLLEVRRKNKEALASGSESVELTLNDLVCWCIIRALKKFPEANSHFLGNTIKTFNRVHLAIAVDTPRGLMVPTVKNADRLSLRELSEQLKAVAEACRKGNINPELIQSTSASFTVSNLGSYGVEMFTPVINLPQTAILGVCTIINRPADLGNNIFGFIPYMGLSLTYDHRAIDGGPATLFLKEIKKQIEKFQVD